MHCDHKSNEQPEIAFFDSNLAKNNSPKVPHPKMIPSYGCHLWHPLPLSSIISATQGDYDYRALQKIN